jgi:hypothetical protein
MKHKSKKLKHRDLNEGGLSEGRERHNYKGLEGRKSEELDFVRNSGF